MTINYPTYGDTIVKIYENQLPYKWYDQTLNTAGDYTTIVGSNIAGCDSIVTLHLYVEQNIVRSEINIVDTVCDGAEYHGRLTTKVINQMERWTDSVRVRVAGATIDSIYNYTVMPYVLTLPNVTADDIIVVCGHAIDVTRANELIQNHIESEPLFAPVEQVIWEVASAGNWNNLTNTAIDGSISTVILRYTIQTACDARTSENIVVEVLAPTPENDQNMQDAPAASKYGDRLIVLNLAELAETHPDLTILEDSVSWYEVVGTVDYNNGGDDKFLGNGYYYTQADGSPLKGQFYARINMPRVDASDCGGMMQTILLNCHGIAAAPKLVPNIVKPNELIRLLNLDPAQVSNITVYTTAGELIAQYSSSNTMEISFEAAHVAGYYIVEVQTELEKISLRYVVK